MSYREKHLIVQMFFLLAVLTGAVSAQEKLFDWSGIPDLFPGIKHVCIDTDFPRLLKINVIRIDLTRKDLGFMTVKRDPDWGKPMPDHSSLPIRTRRITVHTFMKTAREQGIDMLVAVNATPWTPWKIPYSCAYGAKLGLVISDGVMIDEANGRPVFLITKKGEFQIRKIAKGEDVSQIRLALAGFAIILENGKTMGGKKLAPRTAYGLSENNHYMIIMTVDGRMKGISDGLSTKELGEWMRQYGAVIALNMDGGGSTSLVVYDGKNGIRQLTANLFSRKVATSLGIYRIGSKTGEPAREKD